MKLRQIDQMTDQLRAQKAELDGLLSQLNHIKMGPLVDLRISSTVSPPVRSFFEMFDQDYHKNVAKFSYVERNTIRRWREGRDPRLSSFVQVLATLGYTLTIEKTHDHRRDSLPLPSTPGQGPSDPSNSADGSGT